MILNLLLWHSAVSYTDQVCNLRFAMSQKNKKNIGLRNKIVEDFIYTEA